MGLRSKASTAPMTRPGRAERVDVAVTTGSRAARGQDESRKADRFVPHVRQVASALRATPERMLGNGQISVPIPFLRFLLAELLASLPFDEAFYLRTYDDVREAHERGDLPSPRRHFLDVGYFEGRLGCDFEIAAAYYSAANEDVAKAIAAGAIESPQAHYIASGYAEGRIPCPALAGEIDRWNRVLRG